MYNSTGQKVNTLTKGVFDARFYDIQCNGTNMPSEIYFFRIEAASFHDLKKMTMN
jgi:hypothetical protein